MADRTVHYEAAFEAFLRDKGIPCVAVDEAKKALFSNAKLKSFDFVVYSKSGPNLLVDVCPERRNHHAAGLRNTLPASAASIVQTRSIEKGETSAHGG